LIRKFFPLDKNYLLEEAQLELQDDLLQTLVERIKQEYEMRFNPLGLEDSYSKRIKYFKPKDLKSLGAFYQNLAAVYRYKCGDNQLEFIWDGGEHFEKYKSDWSDAFGQWSVQFFRQELFIKAVLDLTVFLPANKKVHLAENRMNNFIHQQFEIKIHKSKGIVAMRVA
jgi:hypothetical protein